MGQLKFDITGDNSNVLKAFRGVQDGVSQTAQIVEQQGQSIENVFSRIKSAASVAFAGFTAKEVVSTLANVRGEFQQLEIAFSTMLGSEQQAAVLMKQLTNLAATTPFDMKGVASGAKSLLAYGFSAEEVTDTMRRLGDVCAGLGLNLQDMAWLYGTTRVQGRLFTQDFRQFTGRGIPLAEELAKQFGVTKDKVQDLVTAGKVGFPEVQKAMESLTNEGGKFGGLMEKQSRSITGQISNIEDTIEMAINDLGTQTEGIMNDALDITSTVIDHWKEIGEVILAAASSIGLYKAMAVGIASFETASTGLGYEAELSALQSILPLKEEEKKTDLEEAVAKGQLSAAQAELVATKREAAAAYVASLQQEALATQQAYVEATNRAAQAALDVEAANEKVEACQQAYDEAIRLGAATSAESAEEALNTATVEANAAAKNLQAAREDVITAAKARDTAATTANTAEQALNTAATARDTAAKGLWAQVTAICQKAQEAWNASMFSSPLFWIAASIAAATYAVYKLVTAETAQEEAVRKTNDAWAEFDDNVKQRQQNIEGLIRTIQSETASEYEKAEAYQKLTALAPQLTEQYDQATLASSDFAKVQKEVSESMDDEKYQQAIQNVEELRKKVESLSMTSQSVVGYTMGGSSNTHAYEEAKEELIQAEQVLNNIITLRDQAAENAKPIEVRLKEAQENEQVRQNIFDFYDEAMTLADDWQSANETINYATGETRLDEFIAKAEKEISDLREEIKKNPADVNLRLQEEEKTKVLNNILAMKDSWRATGATIIPLMFKANWQSAQQSLNQAKSKASALANSGSTETYAEAYTKAQKEYRDAQKKVQKMQKNKSAYSATEYETARDNLKNAKDAYSKLGGDVSGKSAKSAAAAAKKERTQREKEEKKEVKAQEELNKALKSLQQKNLDEEISLMKEGTEKKLKEIDNDYNKRKAEIDKQEAEFKKKNKEAGKKGGLTKEQQSALDEANKLNETDRNKKEAEVYKEQIAGLNEFLKEYGTFKEKQLAIEEEYDKKIKAAQENGNTFEAMSLRAQKQREIGSNKASMLESQIDYSTVFGEFGIILRDQMTATLQSMKDYSKTSDFKSKDVSEQKDFLQRMSQIEQKYGTSEWKDHDFTKLGSLIDDYNKKLAKRNEAEEKLNTSSEELIKANEDYQKILKDGTKEQKEAAKNKLDTAALNNEQNRQNLQNADSELANAQNQVTDAATRLQSSLSSVDKLLQSMTSGSLSNIWESFTDFDKKVNGGKVTEAVTKSLSKVLGKAFEGKSDIVSMIIGAILSILDVIKEQGIGGIVGGLVDSILGAIDGLLDNILSGEFIEQIVSAVVKGIGSIVDNVVGRIGNVLSFGVLSHNGPSSWFTNSNEEEIADKREELEDAADRLKDSIDELKSEMQKQSGTKAINTAAEAVDKQQQLLDNAIEQIKNENNYHSAHHSNAYYWGQGSFETDDGGSWASINKTLQDYLKANPTAKTKTNTANSYEDLLNLTAEQMSYIRAHNLEQWNAIKNVGKYDQSDEKWEAYADLAGEMEDLVDSLNESLTQISFDSLKDEFVSTLLDMDSSAEDFSDKFSEYLAKAVLSAQISNLMEDEMKDFYNDWAERAKQNNGELTSSDIIQLKSKWESLAEQGLAIRDQVSKITGYTGETSQTATSGGWTEMGQDTADELNGRFTALQIAGESIANNMVETIAQMQSIVNLGISTNGAVLEIRNMMINTNSYLEDMVKYAKLTYTDFGSRLDDMYKRLKEI